MRICSQRPFYKATYYDPKEWYDGEDDGMEEGEAAPMDRRMGPPAGKTQKKMMPGEQFKFMGPGQLFKTKVCKWFLLGRAVQVDPRLIPD